MIVTGKTIKANYLHHDVMDFPLASFLLQAFPKPFSDPACVLGVLDAKMRLSVFGELQLTGKRPTTKVWAKLRVWGGAGRRGKKHW